MRELRENLKKKKGVSIYDTDAFIAFMLRVNSKEKSKKNYIFLESFGESLGMVTVFAKLITNLESIIDRIIIERHGVKGAKAFNLFVIDQYFKKDPGCYSYKLVKSLIENQTEAQTIKNLIKSKLPGSEDDAIKRLKSKAMFEYYLDFVKRHLKGPIPICDYLKEARNAYVHHGGIVKGVAFDSLEKVNVSMLEMLVVFNRVPESKWDRFVNGIRNRWTIWKVKASLVRDFISSCLNNGGRFVSDLVKMVWNAWLLFLSLLKFGVKYAVAIAIALWLLGLFSEHINERKKFEDVTMAELLQGSSMEKDRLYMERAKIANRLKSDANLKSIHQRTNELNEYAKEKNEIPNYLPWALPVINQFEWVGEYRKSYLGSLFNVELKGKSYMEGKGENGGKVEKPGKPKKPVEKEPKEVRYTNSGNPFAHYTDHLYFGFESSVISDVDGLIRLASDIKSKTRSSCVFEIKCGVSSSERSGSKLREERVNYVIRRLQEAGVKQKLVASREDSKNNRIQITMYVPEDL